MPSTIECPLCKRMLNLPEDGDGQSVRCPKCYGVFTLDAPAAVTSKPNPAPVKYDETAEARRRRQQIDDEEAERRDRRRYRDDEDYDEYDYLPERSLHFRPHRSGMIQTLGILSIVFSCIPVGGILGLIGVLLGQADLTEMDAGRMDPNGRSATQGGRTCAIIGLVLSISIFGLYLLRQFVRLR